MQKYLVIFLVLFLAASLVSPAYAGEADDFVNALVFGNLSWLYFIVFIGLGFILGSKYKGFNLIMMVACIFQMIVYLDYYGGQALDIAWVWKAVIMGLMAPVFLLRMTDLRIF